MRRLPLATSSSGPSTPATATGRCERSLTSGPPGVPVVLEIEVQGARQVRQKLPEAVSVFIAPPSREALRTRLIGRGTDSPEQVAKRLETADRELAAENEFSHLVVNDRLEQAVEDLAAIVTAALG